MDFSLVDLKQISQDAVRSNLFGMPSQEAAFSLMLVCQSEGIHPIQALRRFHIIKGRPAMRADAMQASFQQSGGKIIWKQRDDKVCEATFSHPQGCEVTVRWTIEMAKQAGLVNNDNWRKFPRQMLHARCVSEGVRSSNPSIVCGFYTPEEVSDFDAPVAKPAPKKPVKEPKALDPKPAELAEPVKAINSKAIEGEVIPSIREVDKGTGAICGEEPIIAETVTPTPVTPTPTKIVNEPPKKTWETKADKPAEVPEAKENIAWYWCENLQCVNPVAIDKNKTINTAMCPNCHQASLHEAKENTRAGAANERMVFVTGKQKTFQPKTEKPAETAKAESVTAPSSEPKTETVGTFTATGAEIAKKIQDARGKAMEFGCRTIEDLKNFTEVCLGKRCGNLTSLTAEELDKIINFKENAA